MFKLKKYAAEAQRTFLEIYGDAAIHPNYCFWFQQSITKSGPENQKKFANSELQDLLAESDAQTLKDTLAVKKSKVSISFHAKTKIQKEGMWLPYELTDNAISNRFNLAVVLLAC